METNFSSDAAKIPAKSEDDGDLVQSSRIFHRHPTQSLELCLHLQINVDFSATSVADDGQEVPETTATAIEQESQRRIPWTLDQIRLRPDFGVFQ